MMISLVYSYMKTDGIWKNNTNLVEAEQVIGLVKELGDTGKSVGRSDI